MKLKTLIRSLCSLFFGLQAELIPNPFPNGCSTTSDWEVVHINEIWDQTPGTAYNTIVNRLYQLLADLR